MRRWGNSYFPKTGQMNIDQWFLREPLSLPFDQDILPLRLYGDLNIAKPCRRGTKRDHLFFLKPGFRDP